MVLDEVDQLAGELFAEVCGLAFLLGLRRLALFGEIEVAL